MDKKSNNCKDFNFPKLISRVNIISLLNLSSFFLELYNKTIDIIWKRKQVRISKNILKVKMDIV